MPKAIRNAFEAEGWTSSSLRWNRAVVRFYNQRGTAEQWIKDGKAATHWTRLSCHRFRTNEVRLLLGVIAYSLGNLLRRLVLPLARLIRHARYFIVQRRAT